MHVGVTIARSAREDGSPCVSHSFTLPEAALPRFSEALRRIVKLSRVQCAVPSLLQVVSVAFSTSSASAASKHDVQVCFVSVCIVLSKIPQRALLGCCIPGTDSCYCGK